MDTFESILHNKLPRHIAIIPDGNNRWAKKQHKSSLFGHRAGLSVVKEIIKTCYELEIEVLSLFGFSSENWNRPIYEVKGLMHLLLLALKQEMKEFVRHRIRLKVIGDISILDEKIKYYINETQKNTANDYKMTLVVAINYGGQWDVQQACKKIAEQVLNGSMSLQDISKKNIEEQLSTNGLSHPDLLIRTSGEKRISNFMLWQFAYTEFYFTQTLWPDFNQEKLKYALLDYVNRQRRFGKTVEQVESKC